LIYEYSGYLRSLLEAPSAADRDQLDYIEFGPDDLRHWSVVDSETDKEWQTIPARALPTPDGVLLRGEFDDTRRLDHLPQDDPSFWVPLGSRRFRDQRLPIDLTRYPVVEVTYRCPTKGAIPACVFSYAGGLHFDGLAPSHEWRRTARLLQHGSFPERIEHITFRLFSTTRTTEELEIQSVRFRAMSALERDAIGRKVEFLEELGPPRRYPLLDEFMPMGVCMKAGSAKRCADAMEISFRDYWRLALEDIARNHHNCVAVEELEQLSPSEWRELLGLAASYGLRIHAEYNWSAEDIMRRGRELVDEYVRPYADAPAMLAWSVCGEPPESTFLAHLQARNLIEQVDKEHPLVARMREPNGYPLFAPHFAASGISLFHSNSAWDLGTLVYTHYPLGRGQQFWITAPAFVYGTETPGWNTCPEMRLMLNQAFANGARGWFAFSYHNEPIWAEGAFIRSLTGPYLTFSDLWSELGHRMERFNGLAPLFLNARPSGPPEIGFKITAQAHPRSRRAEGIDPIDWRWLQGEDFALLYILSNDIGEVTPVNIEVPAHLPKGLEVYDMTEFVRTRVWVPMKRTRHLEMFPGQGECILIAEPKACEKWRDLCAEQIMEDDRRQIALDLGLARRYDLDVASVQHYLQHANVRRAADELLPSRDARDHLVNILYRSPELVEPRSALIRASAAICGCDGTLCRMMAMGRVDQARELGRKIGPLTSELTALRLRVRRGHGAEVLPEANKLVHKLSDLLGEIRKQV
jgi:hypothetical protein